MIGSSLIDAVNDTLKETRVWVEDEMILKRSVAGVDVQGIMEDGGKCIRCGFSYTAVMATGEAEHDEVYRDFLKKSLHSAHACYLRMRRPSEMSWGNSPVVVDYTRRYGKYDGYIYSIAVAAIGGNAEENDTIVRAILDSIPRGTIVRATLDSIPRFE